MAEAAHVISRVRCADCRGVVELECKGLDGFWGYQSYNEYLCPLCGKRNTPLTSGTVLFTRTTFEPASAAP
jgi:hypothetical protein